MSFLKGLVDSLSSILPTTGDPSPTPPTDSPAMEVGTGALVSNERVAYKLKSYFELAKEEIDKAVRAEEWGLVDDAIAHYGNAQRVLAEATSTPTPSFIASRFGV